MLPPVMTLVVTAIATILALLFSVFLFSAVGITVGKIMGYRRSSIANLLWYWTKWPAMVFVITYLPFQVLIYGKLHWYDYLNQVLDVYYWWASRNVGDDDDHKKLKKKLKEKVTALNGRLVVQPA